MDFAKTGRWIEDRVEAFPLVPPHPLTKRKYPNGMGVRLRVSEKEEIKALFDEPEMVQALQAFIWHYGVIILRCLDDQPFGAYARRIELERLHPAYSLPFHVDIDRNKFLRDDYTKWEAWTWGAQGLFQDPVEGGGRALDTLIAPVPCVAATVEHLTQEQKAYVERAVKSGMDLRSKHTCKQTARLMAWHSHFIATFRSGDQSELPRIESINQTLFQESPQVLRVPWSAPELAQGGALVFWDGGFRNGKKRPLVHARDNKGLVFPDGESSVYRF